MLRVGCLHKFMEGGPVRTGPPFVFQIRNAGFQLKFDFVRLSAPGILSKCNK
jgi:hypothetical protein